MSSTAVYTSYDDHTLVQLLSKGDEQAFETIYDRYVDALYNYIARRIHDKEESKEIVQEIFEWLWSNHESINITTALNSYLYGACKHRILNHIRSQKVQDKYISHFTHFVTGRLDHSTEELIDLADLQTSIEHIISQLPDKCQTAFRMSRIEHEPIQRIAERMNISPRTVENYISQALKFLRANLEKDLVWLVLMSTVFVK